MKRALALGTVAFATILALAGCAGHSHARTALQPAGHPVAGSTQPAPPATVTTPGAGTLDAIDADLTSLDHSLAGIDSQITDADKAADDDN